METHKKQITFRGKTIEELKTLSVREFAKYVESRKRRSILRQFQELEEFVHRAKKKIAKGKKIKTHKRNLVIIPEMIGMKIQIYNGQNFIPIEITGEMLGYRFGEFALTRARIKHGKAGVGATKGTRAKAKK
jgi:small subunit ribosomal protein S19